MDQLPDTVYVRLEEPGENGYLVADPEPDGSNGDRIGEYRLVRTGTVGSRIQVIVDWDDKPLE